MPTPRTKFSDEELAFVRENASLGVAALHAAFVERFSRTDVKSRRLDKLRLANGWYHSKGLRLRLSPEGYVVDRIRITSGARPKYRQVYRHRRLWEAEHGAIPAGMTLKCLGDKTNTSPSNWMLVPNGTQSYMGVDGLKFDDAPLEVRPAIVALACLKHAVRSKQRKERTKQHAEENEVV